MAKDRKKLQHIHSSVPDKQPTPATLEVGEIAVNNAANQEFISIKNSENKVVRFSSDEQAVDIMEKKEVMPYKGYVRGETGPSSTSGDTPSADTFGSYGITENDLLNNTSNIIIKLNQVVADNTVKHDKVNGAKDAYNKLVNPTNDSGITDGAGFYIDMSRYAMQEGNPSFSSITTTCNATFKGTTKIEGTDGECGGAFIIDNINDVCFNVEDAFSTYGHLRTDVGTSCDGNNISIETTLKGEKILIESPDGDSVIDMKACERVSASTNNFTLKECNSGQGNALIDVENIEINSSSIDVESCGKLNIKSNDIVFEQCENGSGTTTIKSCNGITLESKNIAFTNSDCSEKGQLTMETNDLCLIGDDKANLFGAETNIGINCDGPAIASATSVYGENMTVSAYTSTTIIGSANTEISTATTVIGENIVEVSGNASLSVSGNNTTTIGGDITSNVSGTTNENYKDAVTINNLSSKTENSVGSNTVNNSDTYKVNTSGRTEILSTGNTVMHTEGSLELTAREDIVAASSESDIIITADNNICETAGDKATLYGANQTNIGLNCNDSDASTTTKINGDTIITSAITASTYIANSETIIGTNSTTISGNTTINTSGTTTENMDGKWTINAKGGAEIIACDNFTITTNSYAIKQCSSEGGRAEFDFCDGYKINSDNMVISGCTDNGTMSIIENTINISGDTINETTNSDICIEAGSTVAIVGTEKTNIGKNCSDAGQTSELNINGDTINETGVTVNISGSSNVNVSADTICFSGKTEANMYAPTTNIGKSCAGATAGTINISGTTINEGGTEINNYFSTENHIVDKYNISAETETHDTGEYIINVDSAACIVSDENINIGGRKETNIGYDCDGNIISNNVNVSAISSVTINSDEIYISGSTKFSEMLTVSGSGFDTKLSWSYDDVKNSQSGVTNFSENKSFKIPKCASHLNRGTLDIKYGSVSAATNTNYDPGEYCSGVSASTTITIPKTISDITKGSISLDSSCFNISSNVCVNGTITASQSIYSSSDERLKENITNVSDDDLQKTKMIEPKSFNFKNDETKKKYFGFIAQDVERFGLSELVHVDKDGFKSVDYTSLLVLKVSYLEDLCNKLISEIEELNKKIEK